MLKPRAISSASAFLNDEHFETLAYITDIHPVESWKLWYDEDGNKLRLLKNKSVQIYYKDFYHNIFTTDLFKKSKPYLIAQNSYWVLYLESKKSHIVSFLGNDGRLRSCLFESNVWKCNIPPLTLGYQILRYISSGYIDKDIRKINPLKFKSPKSFDIEKAWASGYPSNDENLQEKITCLLTNQYSQG